MVANELRRAYVVLDLSPPVTKARLRRQYKALVKRWHPDRYQADPAMRAEASLRLRDINAAYNLVVASLAATETSESARSSRPSEDDRQSDASFGPSNEETAQPFSLSREQMDAIVDSINQMNRLWPEMSVHRWLSVAAVVMNFIASILLVRNYSGPGSGAGIVGTPLCLSLLGGSLIWKADAYSHNSLQQVSCRFAGWLFLAVPLLVALVF